jgi:hypothetical protein
MQGAPNFYKIELLIKDKESLLKEEFYDSGMVITGDYIIIVSKEESDWVSDLDANKGLVYNLKDVKSYKTYNKKIKL